MTQDRRAFLKHSAAALSAASLGAEDAIAATPSVELPRALDATLLRAVGDAVLPEAIGPSGREVAVAAFELWLSDFQPVAELTHPYGGWEIPYGPPDPEPGWSAQLEALDLLAQARWGSRFASLPTDRRREILGEQMGAPIDGFPAPGRARHVAVALMAHYFTSADAVDRCYGVRITKLECRSIDDVGERPERLLEDQP
jgi:hypothetical protein